MAERYDVLIVGSGQAGNPLSSDFVKAGKRVALIERAQVGPSKSGASAGAQAQDCRAVSRGKREPF